MKPQRFQQRPPRAAGVATVVFRFATGQHLDGKQRGDATFLRDGTMADPHYWGRGGDPWWARLAGWKRASIRWAVVLLGVGLAVDRSVTVWVLALVAAPLAGVGTAGCFRRWQGWGHYRAKVRPFALSIVPATGQPASGLRSWAHVPRDYDTREDAEVVVDVPDDFTAATSDMQDIERAAAVKLGILQPKVIPLLDSRLPRVVITRSQPPPLSVTFADIRADILAAAPSQVVLGLGQPVDGKRNVILIDLDSETPMAAASMTTGDGKSALARNFGTQLACHGALVIVLDYKWFSHMWADGLPNVCYARTPEQIHQVLCWLASDERDADGNIVRESELTRRKAVGLASSDLHGNVTADVGPRILVIAEEGNSTSKVLKRYWRSIGGKGASPALEALDEVGATGRQLRVNVLYIAQRLSARASGADGTADARENIGAIITKDPTKATWDMLAGGHAQPPSSGHPGRYQLILRKEVSEFQGAWCTPEEARAFAVSGVVAVPRFDMPFVTRGGLVPAGVRHPDAGATGAPDLGLVATVPASLAAGGTVKLADMVAAGLFVSIAAARKASTRDPLFPAPAGGTKTAGYRYAVTDVYEYLAAKGKR